MGKGYHIEESRLNQGLWSVVNDKGTRIAACNNQDNAELVANCLNIVRGHKPGIIPYMDQIIEAHLEDAFVRVLGADKYATLKDELKT